MKKTLLLLCTVLLSSTAQVMAIVLPSDWTWTGDTPSEGKTYYLYDTSTNKFWYSNPNKIQTDPDRYYGQTDDISTATPVIYSGGGNSTALKYYIGTDYYYLHQKDATPTMTPNGEQQTMRVTGSASGYAIYNDKSGSSYRYLSRDDEHPGTCHFPRDNNYFYWIFISQEQMARYCARVAKINGVQPSAGWESITEMPANPDDYYFAFVSADVPGIMVNMQSPEGRHNTQGKALYYADANEVNSVQNRGYLWTIKDCGDNVQAFTNVEDGHYVQTHEWSWSWHIYASDLTETNNLTRMGFQYNINSGSWTIENLNYPGNYLGSWDKVRPANGKEFCGNNAKGSNVESYIANLLIYAVRKDIYALPNNSESGWTTGVACNTWSTEANSDDTGFVTPFNQVHTGSGSLADASYSHSFTPTQTGQYKVSAWVRATNENGGEISGATMWAGLESNNVDICTGDAVQVGDKSAKGKLAVRSVRYNATEGTPFNVGFKLDGATFNWLAFKNVTITYLGEILSAVATTFTSGNDATAGTWYAFSVPANASYMLSSTAAAMLSYSQDGNKCVNDDDFSTLDLTKGASKCLILNEGTYYFKSDANTTLTITTPENGENVTKLIVNPSFESNDMMGWTAESRTDTGVKSNSSDNYSIIYGDPVDGSYIFNSWGGTGENNVYQTINNLPAGTYHLSALLAGFKNETLTLSANSVNSSIIVPDNGDNSKKYGYTTSLYFTLDAAGNVQIKATNTKGQTSSDGSFIKADNFRLTYYENDQVQTVSDAFTSGNATTAGAWKAVTVTEGNYMLTSTASATLSYTQDGEKSFSANDFSSVTLAAGVSKCITLAAGTLYFKSNAAATLTLTPFVENLDMTSCITNSDFENNLEGWTTGNFEVQSGNANYSGKFAQMWAGSGDLAAGDLNQTLNLPAGTYTLTAKSWADISCHLYASIGGVKQELSYQTAEAVDRDLTFAVATTSDVVIGIYHEGKTGVTGSTWVSCDDFRLTYLGLYHEVIDEGDTQTYEGTFTEDVDLTPTVECPIVDITGATFTGDITAHFGSNPNGIIYATSAQKIDIDAKAGEPVKNVISSAYNVCERLVITDGYSFVAPFDFEATNATYSRTIGASTNFGTICVPFALTSNEDIQYYTTDEIEGGVLKLTEVDNVAAGTPAIFKKKDGEATNITASTTATAVKKDAGSLGESIQLVGKFERYVVGDEDGTTGTAANGNYYIGADNKFYEGADYIIVNPFRAYLETTGDSPARLTIRIDEETAINELKTLDEKQGLKDGKYLIGGKIVVVKDGHQFIVNGVINK